VSGEEAALVFTGLIADLGAVEEIEQDSDGALVRISTRLAGELAEGDSVAVNGVCLTATRVADGRFSAQAMNETLERSALGRLAAGDSVNLELALRAQDRLGGHVVQGHVDGTAEILEVRQEGFSRVVRMGIPEGLGRYLVEKGSVAVNGVSLTISSLGEDWFEVSLIPETIERTNLGRLGPCAPVNIEVDVLAKHVERLLGARV
jgi:riboflavin synthase